MASFLDNVVLEDFDFILEGEQAEAYKKRKAEEAKNRARDEHKHIYDRGMRKLNAKIADSVSKNGGDLKGMVKDQEKILHNMDKAEKYGKTEERSSIAFDAMDRHARRHPQKESTFFDDVDLV